MNKFIDRSIIFIHSSFSTLVMSIICVLLAGFSAATSFVYPYYYQSRHQSKSCKSINNIFIIKQFNYEFKKKYRLEIFVGNENNSGCHKCRSGIGQHHPYYPNAGVHLLPILLFLLLLDDSWKRTREYRAIVRELELLPSVLVICDDDAEKLSNPSQRTKIICNNRKQSPSPPPPYCSNKSLRGATDSFFYSFSWRRKGKKTKKLHRKARKGGKRM